jgi:hypothetical protein
MIRFVCFFSSLSASPFILNRSFGKWLEDLSHCLHMFFIDSLVREWIKRRSQECFHVVMNSITKDTAFENERE